MLDGDDRLKAVPELELSSDRSDGEAEEPPEPPELILYPAKRSSRSSTGDSS